MTQLGITPETTVVLYDDEGSLHAAWLFLVLDVLGHSRVSVLDGGAQRWRAGGGAWTTTVPPAPASVPEGLPDAQPDPASLRRRADPSRQRHPSVDTVWLVDVLSYCTS